MYYEKIFRACQKRRIQYLVVGGVAVNLHGYPRATGDLDLMLASNQTNLKRFVAMIKSLGWRPRLPVPLEDFANDQIRQKWIHQKNMKVFSVFNPKDPIEHIDILTESYLNFKKAYQRRSRLRVGDLRLSVASIPDLIKLKQISARERDIIDIKALKTLQRLKK